MDILFKNKFTLTEELLLECRVAFTNKWTKFLSIFGLIICLFGLVYFYSESNFNDKIKIIIMLCLFIYLSAIYFTNNKGKKDVQTIFNYS